MCQVYADMAKVLLAPGHLFTDFTYVNDQYRERPALHRRKIFAFSSPQAADPPPHPPTPHPTPNKQKRRRGIEVR
jgi:hypothetical protein